VIENPNPVISEVEDREKNIRDKNIHKTDEYNNQSLKNV